MTSIAAGEQNNFLSRIEKQYHEAKSPHPARERAWNRFLELGLPTRRFESYRYLKLSRLYAQEFALAKPTDLSNEKLNPFILPECQRALLVFVNGSYRPQLSNTEDLPKRLVVTTLAQAIPTYGTYLNNVWIKSIKGEADPFALMNTALSREGAFLYLPPKTIIETPIQLLFVADPQDISMLMLPHLHTFVGAHSSVKFISTHAVISSGSFFSNQLTEWSVEEGAHVKSVQIKLGISENGWIFDATRTTLKRDSMFHAVSQTDGAAAVRQDYRIALIGENAEVLLNGVWQLREKKEAHTHVYIDHQAPSCRSRQVFKGVLDDDSRSSFQGKIYIRPQAQQTEAFQTNHNLLLSDTAHATCMPHLEIFADDVKASHGATVGQLDKEQLFFLKARGIPEEEAKNLLVQGFLQEILEKIREK